MDNIGIYQRLLEEIEYSLAEERSLFSAGPTFIIRHGYHERGTLCLSGETVEEICLWSNCREYPLLLASAPLLLLDCLHRYRRLTAGKIEEVMLNHPFYTRYGYNRSAPSPSPFTIPRRTTSKVFVSRIRNQMSKAFCEAGLPINPRNVLLSELLDSKTVAYRLNARIILVHLDKLASLRRTFRRRPLS